MKGWSCNEQERAPVMEDYDPADDIAPELEKYRSECQQYVKQEEDVLSYAVFNQVAVNYFKYRMAKEDGVDKDLASKPNCVYPA